MSTAQVMPSRGVIATRPESLPATRATAPFALLVSLLAVVLYAAFAGGATSPSAEARLQVVLAAVTAVAGGAWLWSGTLRYSAPRVAYAGLALLAAFVTWNGISLLWSVAPEQTWVELNRGVTYLLVLCLAVMVGASLRRPLELVAGGFVLVVLAVTAYALGQKLLPGLHVDGLFSLNQTGPLPRLQEPFGYWNALALFVAMGVPIALVLAVDRSWALGLRVSALLAVQLMLLTIGLTYSRGGLLALVLALAIGIPLSRAPLRSMLWLAVAVAATMPPLIVGLTSHSLTVADVGLAHREAAGIVLAAVLLVSSAALILGSRKLLELEQRVRPTPEQKRRVRQGLALLAASLILAGLVALTLSPRGLGGTVSHAWRSFTATRATNVSDPRHLLSADSENRWVWWKEAAGAAWDRPLAGWGAGSFPVVHLLYRRDSLTVNQPHSVPLQWLAELGLIGALAGILASALVFTGAVKAVRRSPLASERLLAAALLTGAAAYAIHALYDWDWDIPGVTLPALLLLGVLVGSARREAHDQGGQRDTPSLGLRGLAVGWLTLCLCAFGLSVVLPRLASSNAGKAVISAGAKSQGALAQAASSAALASRLDPLSAEGPQAQATIALQRGDRRHARRYLLEAVSHDPSAISAWGPLAGADAVLGDLSGAERAIEHLLALDPRGQLQNIKGLAQQIRLDQAPPRDSPSATPLPTTTG